MLTIGALISLALGPDEASHVDTAIPQHVFDRMTIAQREDSAGWYYDRTGNGVARSLLGRPLSKTECWMQIRHRLKKGELSAHIGGGEYDIAYVAADWDCLPQHAYRGEITIQLAEK